MCPTSSPKRVCQGAPAESSSSRATLRAEEDGEHRYSGGLAGAPHGLQEGPAHLGVEAWCGEQEIHAVEQTFHGDPGMGFEVPNVVAFALEEPRQDVLGQRVGAKDGYGSAS